jgi:hypothetical protein
MNICQPHWDRLKLAITSRGLADFIAKDGKEAVRQAVTQIEDPTTLTLENFDPLMGANNLIFSAAMQRVGLALLAPDPETGRPPCPICKCAGPKFDQSWIDGAADQAAEMVARLRKGPVKIGTPENPQP